MEKTAKQDWVIDGSLVIDNVKGSAVCIGYDRYGDDLSDWQTNSLKIAAAPEMLALLQKIKDWIEGPNAEWWMNSPNKGGFDIEIIDALIAKATGQ